jgi:hypothetical protein
MQPITSLMPQKHGKSYRVPVLHAEPQRGDMLGIITRSAQHLTDASGAALAISDGKSMVCRASSGATAPSVGAQGSMESGFTGSCVRTRNVQRCDDTEADLRVNADVCRSLGIRSILGVPIIDSHGVTGILEVLSSEPNAFDDGDVNSVSLLAALVQLALVHPPQQEVGLIAPDVTDKLEKTGNPEPVPTKSNPKQALTDHSAARFGEMQPGEGALPIASTLPVQIGLCQEIRHISNVIEEGKCSSWNEICSRLVQEINCSEPQSVALARSTNVADETNEGTGGPLDGPGIATPLSTRKRTFEKLLSWIKGGAAAL